MAGGRARGPARSTLQAPPPVPALPPHQAVAPAKGCPRRQPGPPRQTRQGGGHPYGRRGHPPPAVSPPPLTPLPSLSLEKQGHPNPPSPHARPLAIAHLALKRKTINHWTLAPVPPLSLRHARVRAGVHCTSVRCQALRRRHPLPCSPMSGSAAATALAVDALPAVATPHAATNARENNTKQLTTVHPQRWSAAFARGYAAARAAAGGATRPCGRVRP